MQGLQACGNYNEIYTFIPMTKPENSKYSTKGGATPSWSATVFLNLNLFKSLTMIKLKHTLYDKYNVSSTFLINMLVRTAGHVKLH